MTGDGSRVITGVRRVGADALLIEVADEAWVPAVHAEVERRRGHGWSAVDVVPAARTVLIDGVAGPDAAALADQIPAWDIPLLEHASDHAVTVPVIFDGPDLSDVARLWGRTEADVVATVVGTEFRVAFCGFAPGFGYLTGLPPELAVPRRESPRTRVPAGAMGLAGPFAGVYPRSSPGGWQLMGTAVDVTLWDPEREPPALLAPGTAVRFVDAGGAS